MKEKIIQQQQKATETLKTWLMYLHSYAEDIHEDRWNKD